MEDFETTLLGLAELDDLELDWPVWVLYVFLRLFDWLRSGQRVLVRSAEVSQDHFGEVKFGFVHLGQV